MDGEDSLPQSKPMDVFQKEALEVAAAFNGLIMSLVVSKGLDQKTRQLINISMKASTGDQMAVMAHVPMAKAAGVIKEEVVDTNLMTLTVSGIRGVLTCLPEAVRQYEVEFLSLSLLVGYQKKTGLPDTKQVPDTGSVITPRFSGPRHPVHRERSWLWAS